MAQKFIMTQEGLNELKKRLEELKKDQAQNIIDIQDARSQGDLSENADYAAARERQGKIATELAELENKIKNAEVSDVVEGSNFNKVVKVEFLNVEEEEDRVHEYQIVGSVEADPLNGKISSTSPLGEAVLMAKVGETKQVRTETGERFDVKLLKVSNPKKSSK